MRKFFEVLSRPLNLGLLLAAVSMIACFIDGLGTSSLVNRCGISIFGGLMTFVAFISVFMPTSGQGRETSD